MRKSKLTPKRRKLIVEAIKDGNTNETAARLAGISEATLYNWLAKGRDEENGDYRKLLEEVEAAEAEAMAFMVDKVKQAAYEDWRAAAWYLERRRPADFGRRDRVTADLNHSGTIKTEHEEKKKIEVTHMLKKDPELRDLYKQVWERQQIANGSE